MAARLLSLTDVAVGLRNQLIADLASHSHEGVLLPQAERNEATGTYKNIAFRLNGREAPAPHKIFSPKWMSGVSMVKIKTAEADRLLMQRPEDLQAVLDKLVEAIPSECADSGLRVGPELDCDTDDRDAKEWTAGFDGPDCFVGLYSAEHSAAPDSAVRGMNRVHAVTYLVVKAGAGLAGATFHARLQSALRGKGLSLNAALEAADGDPGPQALRRLEKSGSRNRARILLHAAETLGLTIDTVPDQSSRGRYRLAVPALDVNCNVLRKDEGSDKGVWQYSTCVDAAASTGLCTLSNAADGVVLLLSETGEVRFHLRNNEAHSTLPFSSCRLCADSVLVQTVAREHAQALASGGHANAHPDRDFFVGRFGWAARRFNTTAEAQGVVVEPLPLWGSHDRETWLASYARELGVASCQIVRLRPRLVCIAAVEQGKLRGILRNLSGAKPA